jgi:hypothetical protein
MAVDGQVGASGPAGDRTLMPGSRVSVGDRVSVGAAGTAQIEFSSTTRVVAANGAAAKIAALDLTPGAGKRKSFELESLEGVFRFLSDETGDRNYMIRTPSATIDLSGTKIDYTVTPKGATWILLLDGEITACGAVAGTPCITVATPCALLGSEIGGGISQMGAAPGIKPDEGGNAADTGEPSRAEIIDAYFPYQKSQDGLLDAFKVARLDCSSDAAGGLAEFALDGPQVRIPKAAIAAGAAAASIFLCAVLCTSSSGGSSGGPTSTNGTN